MLKRCPFCGSKRKIINIEGKWGINCVNPDCHCSLLAEFDTQEQAIDTWNNRSEVSYNINAETLINYLEENEWEKVSKNKEFAVYRYHDDDLGDTEVKVPLNYGSFKFENDMKEVIHSIAEVGFDTPADIIEQLWDEQVYCTNCFNYIDDECKSETSCYFGDPADSAPLSMRHEYRTIELGNLLFGNSRGQFPVDRDLIEPVFWDEFGDVFDTYMFFMSKDPEKKKHITDRGGYENGVFKVNPYYWGEDEDIMDEPNFIYKPEGIEISWYKYPMRDAYSSVLLTKDRAKEIFRICRESINDTENNG